MKYKRFPRKKKKERKRNGLLTNMKVLFLIDERIMFALPYTLIYLYYNSAKN